MTLHRLAGGATLGAETSIDKVLVATTEQATYDAVRRLRPGTVEIDDTAAGVAWRSEYPYSAEDTQSRDALASTPPYDRLAVVETRWIRMLRGEPILDRDHYGRSSAARPDAAR